MSRISWVAVLVGGIAVGLSLGTQIVEVGGSGQLPAVSSAAPQSESEASATDTGPIDLIDVLITPEKRVFYQYIDDTGAVRFVESAYDVPEDWRGRAGRVELNVAPPTTPAEGRMARKLQESLL
jgi:hypothetical protein